MTYALLAILILLLLACATVVAELNELEREPDATDWIDDLRNADAWGESDHPRRSVLR